VTVSWGAVWCVGVRGGGGKSLPLPTLPCDSNKADTNNNNKHIGSMADNCKQLP
jgi:hypothetical protein